MKLAFQRLHIAILLTEDKFTSLTGNATAHQNIVEKIVALHMRMRIERARHENELLFKF